MELSLWRSRSLKLLPPGMFPSFADIQLNVTSIYLQIHRLMSGVLFLLRNISYNQPPWISPLLLSSLRSLPSLLHLEVPPKHQIVINQPGHHQTHQVQELEQRPQPRRADILHHHKAHVRILAVEEIPRWPVFDCCLVELGLCDNLSSCFPTICHVAATVRIYSCVAEWFFQPTVFGSVSGESVAAEPCRLWICLR